MPEGVDTTAAECRVVKQKVAIGLVCCWYSVKHLGFGKKLSNPPLIAV